jgi:hypothetical protein
MVSVENYIQNHKNQVDFGLQSKGGAQLRKIHANQKKVIILRTVRIIKFSKKSKFILFKALQN